MSFPPLTTTSKRFIHTQHSPGLHAHRPPEYTHTQDHKKELKPATDFWQTMGAYLQAPSFGSYSGRVLPRSNSSTFTSPSPAARGGTAPVAQLNNAPTFQAFINQTTNRLIFLGRGAPSAVGDGKTVGALMRLIRTAAAVRATLTTHAHSFPSR